MPSFSCRWNDNLPFLLKRPLFSQRKIQLYSRVVFHTDVDFADVSLLQQYTALSRHYHGGRSFVGLFITISALVLKERLKLVSSFAKLSRRNFLGFWICSCILLLMALIYASMAAPLFIGGVQTEVFSGICKLHFLRCQLQYPKNTLLI